MTKTTCTCDICGEVMPNGVDKHGIQVATLMPEVRARHDTPAPTVVAMSLLDLCDNCKEYLIGVIQNRYIERHRV